MRWLALSALNVAACRRQRNLSASQILHCRGRRCAFGQNPLAVVLTQATSHAAASSGARAVSLEGQREAEASSTRASSLECL